MFGTVEAHMLQEVCQTALVVILLDRAYTLGDKELSTLLGPRIVADVIRHAVVQLTHADIRVGRDRHSLLGHHGCRAYQRQQSHHHSL